MTKKLTFINTNSNSWTSDNVTTNTNETIKEEKEMSTITKNNETVNTNEESNANANVNEIKEEKKMTKANTSIADLRKMIQEEQETITGESFDRGSQAPEKWACIDKLGVQNIEVTSVDIVTRKFAPKKKDAAPRFTKSIQITMNDEEQPIFINYQAFLYNEEGKIEVDIFDAITNGSGTKGCYLTVKSSALEKKPEELTADDVEINNIQEGERIWIPAKKELKALAKQLGVSEITFDENDHAEIPATDNLLVYVYEDAVKDKIERAKKGDIAKYQTIEYFYNVSFIRPEDQYNMKYGRIFTTSEDANRRAEIAELPGVVRYLESC